VPRRRRQDEDTARPDRMGGAVFQVELAGAFRPAPPGPTTPRARPWSIATSSTGIRTSAWATNCFIATTWRTTTARSRASARCIILQKTALDISSAHAAASS
jgi:hypothetical protein